MKPMSRREAVGGMAGLALSGALPSVAPIDDARADDAHRPLARLKQSVSRWCYGRIPLDDLCVAARDIGLVAIDLLDEKDWATPAKYGLTCAMANGFGTIPRGFNRLEQHDKLVADGERMIPLAAAAKVPNIVCLCGTSACISEADGGVCS